MKNPYRIAFSLLLSAGFLTSCQSTNSNLPPIADDIELAGHTQPLPPLDSSSGLEFQPSGSLVATARTITIDGSFGDWVGIQPAMYLDGPEARTARNHQTLRNATEIFAAFDNEWLYLKFNLAEVANLQGLEYTMALEFDLDGNPLTGVIRQDAADKTTGLPGVDYLLEFSPRDPKSNYTGGTAATAFERGVGSTPLNPYTLSPSFAPTYAHDQIELRIRRNVELPGTNIRALMNPTFSFRLTTDSPTQSAKVAGLPMTVTFGAEDAELATAQSPVAPSIRRPGGTVRVMSWNVERGRLFDDPASFTRVIRAINPHVICFQEIGFGVSPRELQGWLEKHVRAPEGWDVQVSPDTGTAIATRIASVRTGPIRMPAIPPSTNPIRNTMLLIASEGRRIVVSSIHLKCCGRAGDKSDQKRIAETEQIKQLIAEAVAEDHATGILIMGDFNLVGSRIPLDNLVLGTDLNGTNLRDIAPLRINDHINTTWRDNHQPYLPGRLDFALISDSTIRVLNSFLLDTELLSARELDRLKLMKDDTTKASDHLPMIVDLKW